jgi:hypothetical protein
MDVLQRNSLGEDAQFRVGDGLRCLVCVSALPSSVFDGTHVLRATLFFGLVGLGDLRKTLASLRVHCWGGTAPSQVVIAAMLTRTTASA